jgi:hypothetical protein
MKYSQMIAELNLPQIENKLLRIINVLEILGNKMFIDLFSKDTLLVIGDDIHCMNDCDCVF